jgi:hypothetical protein
MELGRLICLGELQAYIATDAGQLSDLREGSTATGRKFYLRTGAIPPRFKLE